MQADGASRPQSDRVRVAQTGDGPQVRRRRNQQLGFDLQRDRMLGHASLDTAEALEEKLLNRVVPLSRGGGMRKNGLEAAARQGAVLERY